MIKSPGCNETAKTFRNRLTPRLSQAVRRAAALQLKIPLAAGFLELFRAQSAPLAIPAGKPDKEVHPRAEPQ